MVPHQGVDSDAGGRMSAIFGVHEDADGRKT